MGGVAACYGYGLVAAGIGDQHESAFESGFDFADAGEVCEVAAVAADEAFVLKLVF